MLVLLWCAIDRRCWHWGRHDSLVCLLGSLRTHFKTHLLENQACLQRVQQEYSGALWCRESNPASLGADKTQPLNLKEGFCVRREQIYDSWWTKEAVSIWRKKVNWTLSFCWWGWICSFWSSPFEVFPKGRQSPAQSCFKNNIQHILKSTLAISCPLGKSSRAVLEKGTVLVQLWMGWAWAMVSSWRSMLILGKFAKSTAKVTAWT